MWKNLYGALVGALAFVCVSHAVTAAPKAVCDTPLGARYLGYEYALEVAKERHQAKQEDVVARAERRYLEVAKTTHGCTVIDDTDGQLQYYDSLEYEGECVYEIEGLCVTINVVTYRDWDTKAGFVFIDGDKERLANDILGNHSKTLAGLLGTIDQDDGFTENELNLMWTFELVWSAIEYYFVPNSIPECEFVQVEERYFCIAQDDCTCSY